MTTYFSYLPVSVQKELKCIAETLVTPGKGILTADESISAMGKRLQELGLDNTEDIRKKWRQLLFSTDHEISQYIAGVIIFHETLYQKDDTGKLLVNYLKDRCIIPGIKVDTGLVNLATSENEVVTQGLDDLGARLEQYKNDGCEFARWRCVFKIGEHTPSYQALISNAEAVARFASICQSKRICPIIEPQVLPDGNHDIVRCQKVTETVLTFVYRALNDHHVFLEGTVLKPNMVTSSMSHARDNPEDIAQATITALQRTVPPAVPGVCFSSDGQTAEEATTNLNAINQQGGVKPWRLTFAYGRALQAAAFRVWKGRLENTKVAQDEFIKRAKANSFASLGQLDNHSQSSSPIPSFTESIATSELPDITRTSSYWTTLHPTGAKWIDYTRSNSVTSTTSRSSTASVSSNSTNGTVFQRDNQLPEDTANPTRKSEIRFAPTMKTNLDPDTLTKHTR